MLWVWVAAGTLAGAGALAPPSAAAASAEGDGWVTLSERPLDAVWRKPLGDWFLTDAVATDPKDAKRLAALPLGGSASASIARPAPGCAMVNGGGKTRNLLSLKSYGDCELAVEFLIPKGSNAGIKFHGHYEVQIFDSFGAKAVTGSDCGGIYPRAEVKPRYHHIDKGIPPKVNACKAPGEWQTLEIAFVAPRFADGKRVAKARFDRVLLNGRLIHDRQELDWPTGHAWHNREVASGPLLLQADHGPVAFRNLKVREIKAP